MLLAVFLEVNFLIITLSTYFEIQPLDFFSCRLPTAAQLSLFTSKASSFYMRFETKPCQPLRELHLEFQYRDFIKTKF